MHEFQDAGLTDVFLSNGFLVHETRHGRAVGICKVELLTHSVCVALALRTGKLRGNEFRYIRRALELTQATLASMFGRTEQTVANWEKRNQVPLEASLLLKEMCLRKFGYVDLVQKILNQLGKSEFSQDRIIMTFDSQMERWESNFHPIATREFKRTAQVIFNKQAIEALADPAISGTNDLYSTIFRKAEVPEIKFPFENDYENISQYIVSGGSDSVVRRVRSNRVVSSVSGLKRHRVAMKVGG